MILASCCRPGIGSRPQMASQQAPKHWLRAIPKWRLQVALFAMPVLFAAVALLFATESAWFQLRAGKAEGEVVRVYTWDGESFLDGDKVYGPVFRYRWSDGTFTEASLGVSHKAWNFPVGSTRTILYDRSRKADVRVAGFFFNWGIPAVLFALSLATLLPAWLLWHRLRQKY